MLFLSALLSLICGDIWAEDALSSLQQDVILAKQKHSAIAGKMNSARLTFQTQESKSAVLETDRLVEAAAMVETKPMDVTLPAPAKTTLEPKIDPIPTANETPPYLSKNKSWQWPYLDFLFPGKNNSAREKGLNNLRYERASLGEEREALYESALSDNKVTVEEAVEIGLAKNAKLQAAKKNIEVADARLTEAKRALLPTFQAVYESNGGKTGGGSLSFGDGTRVYKGRNHKFNVTQPLYNGGELSNTVRQAEESVRVAKAEYKRSKDDIVHQIRVAYYSVVKSKYNTEYQIELFEKLVDLVGKVKKQKEARVIAEIDYLNLESQYYQVLYQVESTKNDVLSTNVSLKQAMNVEVEGVVPVDLKMNFVKVKPNLMELTDKAVQNNADIRVRAFGVEAAKLGIDISESKKKPHIELRGSYGMLGETFRDTEAFAAQNTFTNPGGAESASIDLEKEWFLGVQGSMPLGPNSIAYEQVKHVYGPTALAVRGSEDWRQHLEFNLWDRFGAITDEKQAQYIFLQAESDYETVKSDVVLRLRDEFYALQRYLIQIDSSTAKLRYQDKQIMIIEYLVNMQEATVTNYVDNLIAQAQDRYAFIQAVADYNISLSSLGFLVGDSYYFENQQLMAFGENEISKVTTTQIK